VLGLSSALAEIGHEVHLVATESASHNLSSIPNLNLHLDPAGKRMTVIVAKRARSVVEQVKPDIVYLRTFIVDYPLFSRHLRRVGVPYVAELNTVTDAERAALGATLEGKLFRFLEGRTLAHAAAWLPVTNEIYQYAKRASRVTKPFLIAKNGFDVGRVVPKFSRAAVREKLGVADSTPVMVMHGFRYPWHGVDRAISMLASLKRPVELWLIGSTSDEDRRLVEQIAKREGVESLVRVFPWMAQEESVNLVSAADVGLGSLALDRNEMTEAQPLKVASYLALGVPVLINYKDLRLNMGLPFVEFVPSKDPRVLARHVTLLLAQPQSTREMARMFAYERLSWKAVAGEVTEFLHSLVAEQDDGDFL